MKKFAEIVVRWRWFFIALTLAVTFYGVFLLKDGIRINSDVIDSLPEDDPAAVLFKDIGKEFKGSSVGMIAIEAKNVLTQKVIEDIARITDSLKYDDQVATVTSLTNIIDIKGSDWGIEIGKLINDYDLPQTASQLDSLRHRVFEKEMYKGSIVSNDTTVALILFTIRDDADKELVAREVRDKILSIGLDEKVYFGGLPFMLNDINDLILHDIVRLIPFSFFMILLVFALSFRSVKGVVLPVLSAAIAIIWTIATMKLFGYDLSIITNTIPILLLAIGSAYSIHVLNRYDQENEADNRKRITHALAYISIPVLMASLTTIVGFLSFVFGSYLTMIKDFGIFTAVGVLYSLIISLVFVPAVISVTQTKKAKPGKAQINRSKRFLESKILQPLFYLVSNKPKIVLTVWAIAIAVSIWGIFNISRDVSILDYFKKNNPTRITENIMQEKLGGSQAVYVLFEGNIQSPEVLNKMKDCEGFMKKDPNVEQAQSVADLIEEMNDVMGEGKQIPDDEAKIQQLWFLLDGQDVMEQLVNTDLTKGIIQARFTSTDYEQMLSFVESMEDYISKNSTDDYKISFTGMPSIYVNMDKSLVKSQFSSLLIAICFVIIVVAGILKSLKYGFLAAIPIISTNLILLGVMGFAGISLDVATVLVASVVLGIGIDYSIHVLTHYRHQIRQSASSVDAIADMFRVSGRAILINVLSVSAGLMVLLFSDMVPLQHFGFLILLSMFVSGFGSLTIISSIIIISNKKQIIKSNYHEKSN